MPLFRHLYSPSVYYVDRNNRSEIAMVLCLSCIWLVTLTVRTKPDLVDTCTEGA